MTPDPGSGALTVVVGVSGGIAAYKAVGVVRALVLAGHDVHVIATDAALRFVGAPTFEAISRNRLEHDLYADVAAVRHVALGAEADLVVIAPATANTIARLAAGLADDLLGNTVLATTAPVVLAPAMHTAMWQNPATRANIRTLTERGIHLVGPDSGRLTGDDAGPGRMAEPERIAAEALAIARAHHAGDTGATSGHGRARDLEGLRLMVTAGGTREPLDPVRFLGNRSSGKQGVAVAQAALDRGAEVMLVAANLEVPAPPGARVVPVSTALELQSALAAESSRADALVMAAAVADFRPARVADGKIKKSGAHDGLHLDLVQNPDILAEFCAAKPTGLIAVGFAAETEEDDEELLALGRGKLTAKGCELLVVNRVGWRAGFGADRTAATILSAPGDIVSHVRGTKHDLAEEILDAIVARRG